MLSGPKPEDIRRMFSSVADGYDRANDVMTLGMARLWRKELVTWSGVRAGEKVLDCATGTGDLALEFKRVVGIQGHVVGTDFCQAMLAQAPIKAQKEKLSVEFKIADVLDLPFADKTFDVCSIAYGIRNVEDPIKAISEMARVVKSNGCVMVLETGHAPHPKLKSLFDFYLKKIVPRIGGWITGKRDAYEYLSRSSSEFPSRESFVHLMQKSANFRQVQYKALMGGASFLYKGIVA